MSDERETLELDVVFVGAGPASLAGAIHLARLAKENGLELAIGVLEKGREITSHAISGAVVDPRALKELFPDDWQSAPFEGEIKGEKVLWMTEKKAVSMPIPPPMNNHGNYVASLEKIVKWMAPKVEGLGVEVFPEFPACKSWSRTAASSACAPATRASTRTASRSPTYEPGRRHPRQGHGARRRAARHAGKAAREQFDLYAGKNPQVYSIGVKELWQLPAAG